MYEILFYIEETKKRMYMKKDVVIKIEHVGKTYVLGKMGGTTLQESLQSWWALKRGKEDPNRRIGQKKIHTGKKFEALKDISCEICKGERVGIIGRNGAGKSTLLKLLSRVTAPGAGQIRIKGRVTSMLEVSTGFNGELTGRENIYLKGAILGMKKHEVDQCVDQIIAFSECEEFIDTPVKRYSSGMYVKLGFAVSAFLNADIFLMDEVLAVGDVAFQKKCLKKMRDVSEDENRTILYVSHNMNTIRELCTRCIVLDHGQIIHDGDVAEGIRLYMKEILEVKQVYTFTEEEALRQSKGPIYIYRIESPQPVLDGKERYLRFSIRFHGETVLENLHMRYTIYDNQDQVVGSSISENFTCKVEKEQRVDFAFDTWLLQPGEYSADIAFIVPRGDRQIRYAYLERAMAFRIEKKERLIQMNWNERLWGNVRFADITVEYPVKEK